jgi:hypothetical protein
LPKVSLDIPPISFPSRRGGTWKSLKRSTLVPKHLHPHPKHPYPKP